MCCSLLLATVHFSFRHSFKVKSVSTASYNNTLDKILHHITVNFIIPCDGKIVKLIYNNIVIVYSLYIFNSFFNTQ
jgi:hypothetical protein